MQTETLESGERCEKKFLIQLRPACRNRNRSSFGADQRETMLEVSQAYVRQRKCHHVVEKYHHLSSRNNRERPQKPEIAEVLQIYQCLWGSPKCDRGLGVNQEHLFYELSTEASKVKRSPSTDAAQLLGETRRVSMRSSPQKGRR
jgi:hypothetical protein